MLLHFVIADHLAHSQSDSIFTMQWLACSLSGGDDLIKIFFRRLEQFLRERVTSGLRMHACRTTEF